LINTVISALIGLIVGFIVVAIVSRFHRSADDAEALPADAH
jgi:predicted DNA repair protein MutK